MSSYCGEVYFSRVRGLDVAVLNIALFYECGFDTPMSTMHAILNVFGNFGSSD